MSWSTFFGPDAFTGTQYTALPSYNAAYAQDTNNGTWRISTNGTSAGASVSATARCYLVSAPGLNQAAEFTMHAGSAPNLQKEQGIALRFTDGDSGSFWGGTGYVAFVEVGNLAYVERLDGGGSHTNLDTFSYTPSDGDVFRFEAVGTRLEVFVNGGSIGFTTDSTYSTGTVSLWCGTSVDDSGFLSIDDFTVYEDTSSGSPWYAYAQQ
jgi:hypothetical protein